ncbi:MAG: hypothetical protein AAF566_14055 [Pseudomonadota bacterium]
MRRYLNLTQNVLPAVARRPETNWPIANDHCFQRIVLDAVCGGVWYDHIKRPAYRNLTQEQATRAVALCEAILNGAADLEELNQRSLAWRGKRAAKAFQPLFQRTSLQRKRRA